jgi:hypothetical protein
VIQNRRRCEEVCEYAVPGFSGSDEQRRNSTSLPKLNLNWILVALMLVQIGCTQVDNLAPDNATDEVTKAQTLVDLVNARPKFQLMSTLIHDAGLVPVAYGPGSVYGICTRQCGI